MDFITFSNKSSCWFFLGKFFLILSSLIFIYELIKKNFYEQLKLNWIYFYIIFIIYNIINSFFATNPISSLQSSFSQIRFLLFSFFIFFCISNTKNIQIILKDSDIVVLQKNYNYLFWSILAAGTVLVSMNIVKKQ